MLSWFESKSRSAGKNEIESKPPSKIFSEGYIKRLDNIMVDDQKIEIGLSGDSYDSIAFKGTSAQYLAEVINEVTALASRGSIYPPEFATWREPILKFGLLSHPRPHHEDDGRLSPAEAVAVKTLADEGSAIAQNLGETTKLIEEAVGNAGWLTDVVDGMANFGLSLLAGLQIREKMQKANLYPPKRELIWMRQIS